MRILALDTATSATAVALVDVACTAVASRADTARTGEASRAHTPSAPSLALESRDDPPAGTRPRHAQRVLAISAELVSQAGGFQTVERIAVGIGPGSFTGLRIGIATARALARSLGVPLVGISTLQALALAAREASDRALLVLLDARRGELFAAGWGHGADPRCDPAAINPCLLAPHQLADSLAELDRAPLAVGDGSLEFRAALEQLGAEVPADGSIVHRVRARAHCILAAATEAGEPGAVRPVYLRAPDAELTRRSAVPR
ncbi:MAG: tRNA (adenosine(37)-N6)-threonylcarbamoyltransferase complex dimerization subunit type 1 TsaB [Solirubrobacteraceae bacterium]